MRRQLATLSLAALTLPTLAVAQGKGLSDEEFEALLKERPAKVPIGAVLTDGQFKAYSEKVAGEAAVDRFMLFNNCEPMYLVVEKVLSSQDEIFIDKDLFHKGLSMLALNRLKLARLLHHDSESGGLLAIQVRIEGSAYGVGVRYFKAVLDPASDLTLPATTWSWEDVGEHDDNSLYVLTIASTALDNFLSEYLRVNEAACEAR